MRVTAKLRNLNTAPRKVRMVADLVRGKTVNQAQATLRFVVKKAAHPLAKLLDSAVANAKNNFQLDPNNLYIAIITVDEGRKNKRWRARARGSANEIMKKTSHINLVLEEISQSKGSKAKKDVQAPAGTEKKEVAGEEKKIEKAPKAGMREPAMGAKKPTAAKVAKRIFRRQVF